MNETEDKTRTPRQDRSIKTKEAILQASMKLFAEKGYYQTNTKQIAAAAGVSTGSFYSYYLDKRAVFIDILHIYNQALLARIDAALADVNFQTGDARQLMGHLVDALLQSHEPFVGIHKELSILYLSDDEIKQLMDEQYEIGRRQTLAYLQMGGEELKTDDPEAAAVIVYEAVGAVIDSIAFSKQRIAPDRLKRQLVEMLVKYLTT